MEKRQKRFKLLFLIKFSFKKEPRKKPQFTREAQRSIQQTKEKLYLGGDQEEELKMLLLDTKFPPDKPKKP